MKSTIALSLTITFLLLVIAPCFSDKFQGRFGNCIAQTSHNQFGETRIELIPDSNRVAVLLSDPDRPPEWDSLAPSSDMGLVRSKSFGPGFRLLDLSTPVAEDGLRRHYIEQLVSGDGIEYATQVYRTARGLAKFPRPVVFVRFHPGVPAQSQREILEQVHGLWIEEENFASLDRVWKLASSARTGHTVLNQVEQLSTDPHVEWAEPDWLMEVTLNAVFPTDPDFEQSWGLHNTGQTYFVQWEDGHWGDREIVFTCEPDFLCAHHFTGSVGIDMGAPEAWEYTTGDPAVIVMIMDVGVELSHPDLNVAYAADFTSLGTGGGPTWPWATHGTAVAGCAAAMMNNGFFSTGIAPGVLLASASIARDDTGDGYHVASSSWFVEALEWGLQIGARVATSQVGPTSWSALLEAAYDNARIHGMVLFAASGNDSNAAIGHPGNYRSVNAIGGINGDGSTYGTTGNELFMVGPAGIIYTTALGGGWVLAGGTSLSSPFAAGVAGLVISANPGLSSAAVEMAMIAGAMDLGTTGFDSTYGHGLLRADEAIVVGSEMLPGAAVVDASLGVEPGAGSYDLHRHATVAAGISNIPNNGAVLVRGGLSYSEALVIDKPLVMRAWDGNAVIGE